MKSQTKPVKVILANIINGKTKNRILTESHALSKRGNQVSISSLIRKGINAVLFLHRHAFSSRRCHSHCLVKHGKVEYQALRSVFEPIHDPSVLDLRKPVFYELTSEKPTILTLSTPPSMPVAVTPKSSCMDLEIIRFVAEGASGQVYLSRDTHSGIKFALKVMKKEGKEERVIQRILKEKGTMTQLDGSPWLTPLYASWHDRTNFYFAMPFYVTDLESEMIRCEVIERDRARFYMAEIIIALTALHSRGIIHRDIKAANLLFDKDGHIVLADYGLSENFGKAPTLVERACQPYWPYLSNEDATAGRPHRAIEELTFVATAPCGSAMEAAPEVYLGRPYSFGVDFWSGAVVGYWMVTGRPPFYEADEDSRPLPVQIIEDDIIWVDEDDVDEIAKDFFERMLQKDPEDRLRIEFDIPVHPYFDSIDWELMEQRKVPTPWIPGRDTRHELMTTSASFKPGPTYYPGEDPFPDFTYLRLHQSTKHSHHSSRAEDALN